MPPLPDGDVDELAHVSQCSIEFSRTSKQEPSWKIKQYHDTGDEAPVLERIWRTDQVLTAVYVSLPATPMLAAIAKFLPSA